MSSPSSNWTSTGTEPMPVVKKLPPSGPAVLCVDSTGRKWTIIQKLGKLQPEFELYKHVENGYEKTASAPAPTELYGKIPWGTMLEQGEGGDGEK